MCLLGGLKVTLGTPCIVCHPVQAWLQEWHFVADKEAEGLAWEMSGPDQGIQA